MSRIDRRPTCLPGVAHKFVAYRRYQVGGCELRRADALRAHSGGVSVGGLDIGVGSAQFPKLSEPMVFHQPEHARIFDRVGSHTKTPLFLLTRQKCDLAITGEVRNCKFNMGHQSLQFVDVIPRRSVRRVIHRTANLLDVVG